MGLIAQEVEEAFPDRVDTDPSGHRRLTARGFEALTVEAFREPKCENEELAERVRYPGIQHLRGNDGRIGLRERRAPPGARRSIGGLFGSGLRDYEIGAGRRECHVGVAGYEADADRDPYPEGDHRVVGYVSGVLVPVGG